MTVIFTEQYKIQTQRIGLVQNRYHHYLTET